MAEKSFRLTEKGVESCGTRASACMRFAVLGFREL